MKILLVCEPRSGSTQLTKWFAKNKFEAVFEPSNPKSSWYSPDGIKYSTYTGNSHIVFKEIFYPDSRNFQPYLEFCDKLIFLYRENKEEQIVSYDFAIRHNSWQTPYSVVDTYTPLAETVKYFTQLKDEFAKFINNTKKDHLVISYEDLYKRNKIYKIKEYLELTDVLKINFPTGKKLNLGKNFKSPLI